MRKRRVIIVSAVALAALIGVAVFYGNEARKEIVVLCGNFEKGVPESSVRRQLDTGSFLRYREERTPSGRRIVADTPFNFARNQCVIEMDSRGAVTVARIESGGR